MEGLFGGKKKSINLSAISGLDIEALEPFKKEELRKKKDAAVVRVWCNTDFSRP